ncbi:hypothetical protein B0A50_00199 [Salinomyces thailandicus]|uniref:Uncharacterized protein n=1 Tax=Salinomyces thailandicus TaxID=706561 RepID=A0A4V5N6W5_9PEZI|nr:hypothetical protein B0A50_00199 [Salinomyces thailandica]
MPSHSPKNQQECEPIEPPEVRLYRYHVEGGEELLAEAAGEVQRTLASNAPVAANTTGGNTSASDAPDTASMTGGSTTATAATGQLSNSQGSSSKKWEEKESLALSEMWVHPDFRRWKVKQREAMFNAWQGENDCSVPRRWSGMEQHYNVTLKKGNTVLTARMEESKARWPIDWAKYATEAGAKS